MTITEVITILEKAIASGIDPNTQVKEYAGCRWGGGKSESLWKPVLCVYILDNTVHFLSELYRGQ